MNKKKRLTISILLLLALALPLVLTSCAIDYKVSELPYENLIKNLKSVSASSGDGKGAVDRTISSCWSPKTISESWLEIEFKNELTFNSAAIKEKGGSIKIFKLQIPDGDKWKTIFYSDGIGNFRLCTFPQVTTTKLRLYIDNAFDNFEIREVQIFNIDKPVGENFQKTAFIKIADYIEMRQTSPSQLDEYLGFYNDIILTDAILVDSYGNLSYSLNAQHIKKVAEEIKAKGNVKASLNILNNSEANPIDTVADCENLINNLSSLVEQTGIQGLTIQFLKLVGAERWRAYNFLIKNLDKKLNTLKTNNGSAPSLSIILESAHVELENKVCKLIDKVYFFGSPMSDYTNLYDDFYCNLYSAVNLLDKRGFTTDKIVLTMPMFAYSINNSNNIMPYSDLLKLYDNLNIWQNLYINVPYGKGFRDFYFQSPVLAHNKAMYAKALGLGGFGVVDLSYDLPMSNAYSITASIANALK